MHIQDLKTFVVGNPPPYIRRPLFHLREADHRRGISGIGEVYCDTFGPEVIAAMIEDVFAPHMSRAWTRSASRPCGAMSMAPATACGPTSR